MATRDHEGIVIEQFNGWWSRGDKESAPLDHFIQADNVQYFTSGVETRDALDKYQSVSVPLTKIRRIYDYVMQTGQSLLVLVEGGKIYHCIGPTTVYGPILTIPTMEDFGFVAIAGRAYITPFRSIVNTVGVNYELGLPNEFVYVYKGDGSAARKAAGSPPSNISGTPPDKGKKPFLAYTTPTNGVVTAGIHVIAVGFNGGTLGTEVFPVVITLGDRQVQLSNIPLGPVGTSSRTIAMTKAIDPKDYKADQTVYTYYTVETIPDNTLETKVINVADSGLVAAYTPAGGAAPVTNALLVANTDIEGFSDFGFHLVGVIYETESGYQTAPGPEFFGGQSYASTTKSIKISNIPVSPSPFVTKRHLVSTKWIPEYNGDQKGYQFYFIPKGTLDNNTATELTVNYYDSDLLSDASHLLDNFAEIPAGVNLNTYHSRMVLVGDSSYPKKEDGTTDTTKPDNRSVAWVSYPGEPEAISQVDGLIVTPLDGNPLTNCQEFRDLLYLFKKTRTYSYSDNGDEPATWQEEVLDQGVGAPVHGIATVLDTGGVNVDFLLIADWSGLMQFNGVYARPEISWKIEDYWMSMARNDFRFIQIVNDSLSKKIWMTLPPPFQNMMLHADYGDGLDAKNIKWARWIFDVKMTCIALIDTKRLIFGSNE
jgi:hypothetical protein